jgi:hypothetical protein
VKNKEKSLPLDKKLLKGETESMHSKNMTLKWHEKKEDFMLQYCMATVWKVMAK